jgi:predicted GNAT family acetyltransferase
MTTTADGRLIDLTRDVARREYRAAVDGRVIGAAEFLLASDLVVFTQTQIDRAFAEQGVAPALLRWALDDARDRGYRVLPSCPVVRAYIDGHDEYADLVAR